MDKEYILCAAIHYYSSDIYPHQPVNITKGVVICGHRHHNCITIRSITNIDRRRPTVKGFITNKNRFVNRKEAGQIAFAAGQIETPLINKNGKQIILTSEDLY